MNYYEFLSQSQSDGVTIVFGILTLLGFMALLKTVAFMWNRFWRHWTLRKHGYPPPHCDADGDFDERERGPATPQPTYFQAPGHD